MGAPLLSVQGLKTVFTTREGVVKAVDGVSFELEAGETLGIVGESGSGKSVTALSIMRLVPRPGKILSGRVMLKDRDLTTLTEGEMQEIRGESIAMIFQDPMTSLNPVFRVGWQVAEPLVVHTEKKGPSALREATAMLGKVGIPRAEQRSRDFPHQFSGGMRQRAMIAMGLTTMPSVLIADEPTTALDVTIQAQILDLLRQVNREYGTATILITHNLGVVAGMCKRVMVMYAGKIVESGPTADVFAHPKHPYTWALLRSIPRLDADSREPLQAISGLPPDLIDVPSGCAFHPRCTFAIERCARDVPQLKRVGETQMASCWVTQGGKDLDA
ncbi:MAG TPA: ABC transporter ATP-binding protein [Candidatus Dormibacteraeota bacterium]|nr:ABC transporter ATP-binding protein [Candidatus Dormibacteraeota bacterium]HEX2680265.1 ABC transporter ATP-binding protein [Candidatus Dormibacteraeota bacterium]